MAKPTTIAPSGRTCAAVRLEHVALGAGGDEDEDVAGEHRRIERSHRAGRAWPGRRRATRARDDRTRAAAINAGSTSTPTTRCPRRCSSAPVRPAPHPASRMRDPGATSASTNRASPARSAALGREPAEPLDVPGGVLVAELGEPARALGHRPLACRAARWFGPFGPFGPFGRVRAVRLGVLASAALLCSPGAGHVPTGREQSAAVAVRRVRCFALLTPSGHVATGREQSKAASMTTPGRGRAAPTGGRDVPRRTATNSTESHRASLACGQPTAVHRSAGTSAATAAGPGLWQA